MFLNFFVARAGSFYFLTVSNEARADDDLRYLSHLLKTFYAVKIFQFFKLLYHYRPFNNRTLPNLNISKELRA